MRYGRPSLDGWRWLRVHSKGSRLGAVALAVSSCLLVSAVAAGGTQPYETYESTVAADGPVAQFRFDDAVGSSTIADSVGSYTAANNGVVLGGEGPFGGGRSGAFGGAAYGSLPGDPLAGASEFTFEGWVDWSGEMVFKEPIFEFGSSSTNYMYLTPAAMPGSHKMLFEIHTSGGSSAEVTTTKLAVNVWKDVAVSETSAGTLTLYVNGEQVGQVTGASVFPSSLGSAPSDYLGKSLVAGEPLFKGSMSNVAFYTKALSGTRIREHYDAGEFPVNTVLPAISGTAKDGSTLTAIKPGTWTGVTPITFAYQWTRCNAAGESCANIPAASETKYKLSHEDVGSTLRVAVTASNSAGTGSASSAQSALVAPLAPSNTVLPVISGAAEQGQLLSVSEGEWSGTPPLSYAYQWESCNSTGGSCKKITGASASTYRVLGSQIGGTLRAVVTAENAAGSKGATSAATAVITTGPPANTALPVVSGTAEDGHTLSASTGSWAGTEPFSYTYQWELCNSSGESCANISGATASTYVLGLSDVGDKLRVVVTAKNSVGSTGATSAASGVVAAIPPSNTSAPTITGSDVDGQTLTAGTGSWSGSLPLSYAYQWELCNGSGESCTNISGATSSTYLLGHGDVGGTLRVKVTASNTGGSASSTSAATGVVAALAPSNTSLPGISGTVRDGQTLTASTGVWEGTPPITYTYQWQTCNSAGEDCANVSGATSSTYVLEHGDVGDTMRVVVRASNAGGSASATSEATGVVTAAPPSNTAAPVISGMVREEQTLSVSTGSWSGTLPFSYTYQWESCNEGGGECGNIAGATGGSYTLGSGNLETTLRVVVTATNGASSAPATSAASAAIEPGPPSELEAPSVSGTPAVGETLQADPGTWAGIETEVSYQWERCTAAGGECVDVAGASESGYTLVEGDVGKTLRIRVGVSNPQGSLTAVSPASPVIEAAVTLVNTWAPSISGTPREGQTLTADAGSWLGIGTIGYAYQWQRCDQYGDGCEDIEGATASTYVLGAGDVGHALRVLASASETSGTVTDTSPATEPVAAEGAPTVKEPPVISGTGLVGYTLIASSGAWSGEGLTYSYQWERCEEGGEGCSAISGATSDTYTLVEGDAGSAVRVLVTAVDGGGSTAAPSFPVTVSAATLLEVSAPSISGEEEEGRTLSADPGIWTGTGAIAYAYEWQRCNEKGEACADIAGATESAYTPVAADVGDTVKVAVTASGPAGTGSAFSAATPVIATQPTAPEDLIEPSIEGNPTTGETLHAEPGLWLGSEPISYSFQWQRCDAEGEECANVSGATGETYLLAEHDLESTIRVVVTASNSVGSASATSEQSEVVDAPGPPASSEGPAIVGTAREGEKLFAANGRWSGSRPLSYTYRWERCNSAGESCAGIEGATKPSYTVASADVGHSLRVKLTVSNSLGSTSALSASASVFGAGEAAAEEAIEIAQATDPSVLAPATSASLEEETVKPALSDTGVELAANATLTSSTVSKETPGEFAVKTPDGEFSLQPVGTAPNATTTPTIVNGTAAVFAGTVAATDTIVRPEALGATALLQLRSADAPSTFSWEVGLGADQQLEELPNGSIAVTEPSGSVLGGPLPEEVLEKPKTESAERPSEEGVNGEAAEKELESSPEESGGSEQPPAAPQTTTPEITPKSGELHPQETKARYERATGFLIEAKAHTANKLLMVIAPPQVMDAAGDSVPATLSAQGDTITMTLSPSESTTYPVTAATSIFGPSPTGGTPGPELHYGLSDPKAVSFEKAEEEPGKIAEHFDTHLESGPLHVKIARDVISYNPTGEEEEELFKWLKAVHKDGLEPYITFGVLQKTNCTFGKKGCLAGDEPSVKLYGKGIERVINNIKALHEKESDERKPNPVPLVMIWGAWNEPDFHSASKYDPMYKHPEKAALFWKKGMSILKKVGCNCTMVAGEFAEYNGYIERYKHAIIHNHSYWSRKPHVWGFHDYHDLAHVSAQDPELTEYASDFAKTISKGTGHPRIWLSEQGVELNNGETSTSLAQGEEAGELQRLAAHDFLHLYTVSKPYIEVADYYLYWGPSKEEEEKKHDKFDSGLLNGKEKSVESQNPREAYCVLALGEERCPPAVVTNAPVAGTITTSASTTSLAIDPGGLLAHYAVEYGLTTGYGHTTTSIAVANDDGSQSETVALTGLAPCTTYHYQAEAESSVDEGTPSLGGDKTFTTSGCEPPTVTTGIATYLGGNTHKLTGEINPNGDASTYYFEYGPTTSYGEATSPGSAGSGTKALEVTAEIEYEEIFDGVFFALPPKIICNIFHFRLVGANAGGTSYGADKESIRCI